MVVIGIVGWSDSGKTTLITRLIPAIMARGVTVSTIKHVHHDFDIDVPGKDSYRHRAAGAHEVMVVSPKRWALMHESTEVREPALDELLARMSPVDLVLVEGFKNLAMDKLIVHREATGKAFPNLLFGRVIAAATDVQVDMAIPRFGLDDIEAIAECLLNHAGLGERSARRLV